MDSVMTVLVMLVTIMALLGRCDFVLLNFRFATLILLCWEMI